MDKIILNNSLLNKIIIFCLLAAFLVKLTSYGVHLWLPKAHALYRSKKYKTRLKRRTKEKRFSLFGLLVSDEESKDLRR
jgi:hypothetical protein